VERGSLARSKPEPIVPATREPALMLSDYDLNHLARLKPSSVNYKLNDHNTNYIPARNSNILTAKQAAEFLQLNWAEGRQHTQDARYSTDKISERTRGKRKSELRKSRDVKIEPRVVCRDAMTSPPLLEHFNGSQPRKSRRKVKAKTPSKKSLVLTALKNLGGEGTIDDVDKWVKKNNPPGYGKVDRRSVSNALYKLAVEKKLEVLDKKKNTIWNVVYRVRRKTPEKKGLISGKSMKKKERFNVLMEGTGVYRTSKEKKDFRKRSNAQVAAMQIPNDKSSSSKIHALPLRVGGCEFTDPNYAFGGSVGVISTDKDRKHHL